jgi:hypothetical protein
MEKTLKERYGEKIEVNYVDTERTGFKDYPLIARVIQMGYPFPVIAIDGQPKLAGTIDADQIHEILEEMIGA